MIGIPLKSRITTLLFNVEELLHCRDDSFLRTFLPKFLGSIVKLP